MSKNILRVLQFAISITTALMITSCSIKNSSYEAAKLNYARGDYARSFHQLWIPAQQKDPRAFYAMGYMYYYGLGTDQDQDIGRSLIRRAAGMKYPPAIIALRLITTAHHNQYMPLENYHISHKTADVVNHKETAHVTRGIGI